MLISQTTMVKWNSKTKKHYTELGYEFTKMGDLFEVNVNDLTDGSNVVVKLKCDYCGKIFEQAWYTRVLIQNKSIIKKDCCKACCELKAKDAIKQKYGSYSELYNASNSKRINTNLQKYGVENVFANDEIKNKITITNENKYGAKYTQQNKDIREKTEQTCLKKYGVKNYVELFKGKFIKENSPCWKGGVKYSRVERATYEYIQWRTSVFQRDYYSCQKCMKRNGIGKENVVLNAHHIRNWKDNPDCRYDVSNGITLCEECHNAFHSKYGKSFNDEYQIEEFILDEKIC